MGKSTINEIFLQKMNEDAGIIWDLQVWSRKNMKKWGIQTGFN